MTKANIVDQVSWHTGLSKEQCADLVELTFEIIKETLGHGENVKISGFGSFVVRQKRARRGRNPQTGKGLEITPRKVVTFKLSPILKEEINSGK